MTRTATDAGERTEQRFAQGNIVFAAEIAYRQRQRAERYGPIRAALELTVRLWHPHSDGTIGSVCPPVTDLYPGQNEMILKLLQAQIRSRRRRHRPAVLRCVSLCTRRRSPWSPSTHGSGTPTP